MLTYDPLLSSITLLHAFTMEIGMVYWWLRAATCVKLQLPQISSSKKKHRQFVLLLTAEKNFDESIND